MSEWDTGEKSESVFFSVVDVARPFDVSVVFFLRHVGVGPATPMLAPMSLFFFFKIWCIRGAGLFCFFSWMSHQRECSGTSSVSHMRIGL